MPTNVYFNNYSAKGEQRLYEDLLNETIKIWGIDSYYMPRTSESTVDLIFGDDPTKKFDKAYPVEVYVKNVDNFEGGEYFSKFGIEIQHQIRFVMTTRSFKARVPSTYQRPREGDLLWLTNFQALFEIKFVNQHHLFYAFGNQNFYGYELVCERFRYSDDKVATGIEEIDDAVSSTAFVYDYTMLNDSLTALPYIVGERVYQGVDLATANCSATVVSWNEPTLKLRLKDISGVFVNGDRIIGETSLVDYTLSSYNSINNTNDKLTNNNELKDLANNFLDFSETNPFGEP